MKKRFCDICGQPATRIQEYFRVNVAEEVRCDKKAKVEMSIHTSFKNHSTGFGGPPDLCSECFVECLAALVDEAIKRKGYLKPD